MTINIDKHGTGAGPVLDIDHLKVTFATDAGDVYAVKDVSLQVNPGEVVAIVGESGSGKTVTAKTILGLLPETAISSGAVLINGNNVISVSPAKLRQIRGRDVAMVFQEPSTALNPVFTVGWQIAEGIRAHAGHGGGARVSAKEAKTRAIEALRKVGIPDPETRVNYYPHQFSGGQKQRVVIAAALALNPGLIVADEPTTALDVTVQAEILELLRDLRDQYGTSIVLITHNMGVVADLADRVVVMYQGDVVEEAPARVLFAEPKQDYTKKLLAAVPHLGRNSASEGMTQRAHQGGKVLVEAKNLTIEYPGRLGTPGLQGGGRGQLHPVRGRGLRPRGGVRVRQDHDRAGHRGPEPHHRRQPEGAGLRNAEPEGAHVQAAAQGDRVRVPGPGRVLQPAADHRGLHRRTPDHPHQTDPGRRPGSGPGSCWKPCSCRPPTPTGSRMSSPAASGSVPPWRGR